MRNYLKNEEVLKECKIFQMLATHAEKEHLSFHTPGHKNPKWDVTELSFSDNLACPRGCIAEAEKDIADVLEAKKSFLLTDGSTAGILSMLYAVKKLGARTIAVCEASHKSVFNGCKLLGLIPLLYPAYYQENIPYEPTMYELISRHKEIFEASDVLFFTSPNYYGGVADWKEIRVYCDKRAKRLLVDGAHGGHLHFSRDDYAGAYADMWVDGVHKSLPALTQGAVVSARTEDCAVALAEGVDIFRTTSPSYPVMASVEYAVKYPRNVVLENAVLAYAEQENRVRLRQDWTKLCALFGENAFEAEKELESLGIYPEFCDGNVIVFYLSPAMENEAFDRLKQVLTALFEKYPYVPKKSVQHNPAPLFSFENGRVEWVETEKAVGRICAASCGLFPPCLPLIAVGERVGEEKILLLKNADNVFGIKDGKIAVWIDEE